jgi:transcription elongation factor Elf1
MKNESVLKKEFTEKEVQRLRNVVQGKAGDRTLKGVGYSKTQDFHQEGDIWTENGRQWTIKDGIKQNITKLDKAKEAVMPLFCPSCSRIMNKNLDKETYSYFRHCFDCHVDFEFELKKKGLWDDYVNNLHNKTIDQTIEGYKQWLEELLNETNSGFVSEQGEVQKWAGGINRELAEKSLDETVAYLESLKK